MPKLLKKFLNKVSCLTFDQIQYPLTNSRTYQHLLQLSEGTLWQKR